jgi:hypothetical protein
MANRINVLERNEMKVLSTGQDSTLGNYRDLAAAVFGHESKAVKYLDDHITNSPDGRDEEVMADESQMIYLLGSML